MILDAGVLVSVHRGKREAQVFLAAARRRGVPLRTTHPVVAQVWRYGARQTRLARLLSGIPVHPMDDGRLVGAILARTGTSAVVDAHLVALAVQVAEPILTADIADLTALATSLPDGRPDIIPWP